MLQHTLPEAHEACDAPLQSIYMPRDSQQPVAQLHVLLACTRHARYDGCLPLRLLVGVLTQLSQPGPTKRIGRGVTRCVQAATAQQYQLNAGPYSAHECRQVAAVGVYQAQQRQQPRLRQFMPMQLQSGVLH
jgi:hypothetical protein